MKVPKTELKEIGRKILGHGFDLLKGKGIRKLPVVNSMIYFLCSSTDFYKIIDGQKVSIFFDEETKNLVSYGREWYELETSSLFCSMLKEGTVVFDVGAFWGFYTLIAAKRVGKNGRVIAFEPQPSRFKGLLKNIRLNDWKNVEVYPFVVSQRDNLDLPMFEGSFSLAALQCSGSKKIKTNSISLDSFCEERNVSPDIVKIDVEGAELEVLRGMEKILAKGKVKIICEVHPEKLSSLGYKTKEIVDLLKQYNYNIHSIGKNGLIFENILSNEQAHYLFSKKKTS